MNNLKTHNIDVLILCGGLGTRFRAVTKNNPKGLALINGKPFLDILVDDLLSHGFQRIIFCVGYLKEQIVAHYQDRSDGEYLFSEETTPLGTGGAIKNAESFVKSNHILILNGDSLCKVNYSQLYSFHLKQNALLSIVLSLPPKDSNEYGNVHIDSKNRIQAFHEKQSSNKPSYINSGIYLMRQEGFTLMPHTNAFSLEYDFFPKILNEQPCYGFVVEEEVWDIGTPERYEKANQIFEKSLNGA